VTARDRLVIVIVVAVAAVAGSWLLVIQPKRDQASQLGDQIKAAQAQLATARSQVAVGQAARATFAHDYTELARLGEAVPADDNVPSLIYQVQSAATAAGVDFRTLVLNPGSGGSAPAGPAASPANGSVAAAQTATGSLPPGASVGPASFPVEPFTFTFRGNFFHLADFFGRLERFVVATNTHVSVSGRLMTLNAISLGPGPKGFPQIAASISATTYLVPASQGLLSGATPFGPAAAGSAQTVSTPGSSVAVSPAAIGAPVR
jgi:hypothetical protein